jgi:ATP-binding cassette, subfamily B (MDR/TAP), member 1
MGLLSVLPMMYTTNSAGQGSRMIASGELNVGLVINVLFAVMIASFSLSQVAPRIENFSKATAAAQKIFQTIYRIPSIDSLSDDGDKPKDLQGDIEFENVSFIYPSRPEGVAFFVL